MNTKTLYALLCLSFLVLLVSCQQRPSVIGDWENAERTLRFTSYGDFEIVFKKPTLVKAFRGSTAVKDNILVLLFEEYQTVGGEWIGVEGTDLEDHKEVLRFTFDSDCLITEVVASGETYAYTKAD